MAATITISSLKRNVAGNKRLHTAIGTHSGTYASGGSSLTPAKMGLHVIEHINIFDVATSSPYVYTYDYTNQKVLTWKTTATATSSQPTATSSQPTATASQPTASTPSFVISTATGITAATLALSAEATTANVGALQTGFTAAITLAGTYSPVSAPTVSTPTITVATPTITVATPTITVAGAAMTEYAATTLTSVIRIEAIGY